MEKMNGSDGMNLMLALIRQALLCFSNTPEIGIPGPGELNIIGMVRDIFTSVIRCIARSGRPNGFMTMIELTIRCDEGYSVDVKGDSPRQAAG
ncbi:MAG: hypothetical protein EXR28_16040 [Betaproteobacteria bacterium]|nr:hypothetical protein [Betaproteobacteria bacterium]